MAEPWTFSGSVPTVGDLDGGTVTVIDGSTFAIGDRLGDMAGDRVAGLFLRDTRVVSLWRLTVDGARLEPVGVHHEEPHTAEILARVPPRDGLADSNLLTVRVRTVHDGMSERVVLHNTAHHRFRGSVELAVASDFAGLFDVKEGRRDLPDDAHAVFAAGRLTLGADGPEPIVVTAVPTPSEGDARRLVWTVDVAGHGRGGWTIPGEAPRAPAPRAPSLPEPDLHAASIPAERLHRWRTGAPELTTGDSGLAAALRQSVDDIGALRIFDPHHPERTVIAAGAPWFMAVFGRDSLLTAWMLLPLSTDLALGVLRTLAEHQGTRVDPATEEQPGRILHELRFGAGTYYGTADAAALFVMLLGELARWTGVTDAVRDLLPHADRALEWIERHGDLDGDGFFEYRRQSDTGLVNQGWKDSWDGVPTAAGTPAEPPIALIEVQGYSYAAFRARAELATALGDASAAAHWSARARQLQQRFEEAFWLPDRECYALALDGDKRPVGVVASNLGHALWSGIVDPARSTAVARALLAPDMFTGWGVRTLGRHELAYNPMSYHNGSVWPHDNAVCVAGLRRYGHTAAAARIALGLLDASRHFGHRLPELFCGFDREEFHAPVPYPASCSPQAWAAAAPLLLLRSLLGLDPNVLDGSLRCDPDVPASLLPVRFDGITVGPYRLRVEVGGDGVLVNDLPSTDGRWRLADLAGGVDLGRG